MMWEPSQSCTAAPFDVVALPGAGLVAELGGAGLATERGKVVCPFSTSRMGPGASCPLVVPGTIVSARYTDPPISAVPFQQPLPETITYNSDPCSIS